MSTHIKTLIQWVYSFLLIAVFIGLSGWVVLLIPVVGSLLDPNPQHTMLWQGLMAVCAVWIGCVELCAATAALLIFCLPVALLVWRHNRRCAPGALLDPDDLLCFPTRTLRQKGAVQQS